MYVTKPYGPHGPSEDWTPDCVPRLLVPQGLQVRMVHRSTWSSCDFFLQRQALVSRLVRVKETRTILVDVGPERASMPVVDWMVPTRRWTATICCVAKDSSSRLATAESDSHSSNARHAGWKWRAWLVSTPRTTVARIPCARPILASASPIRPRHRCIGATNLVGTLKGKFAQSPIANTWRVPGSRGPNTT